MRALLVVAAACAATLVLLAGPAAAATQTISLVGCYYNHGGQVTVPSGTDVTAQLGWAATNPGFVRSFLSAQTTTVTVDGQPADGTWGAVEPSPQGFVSRLSIPLGPITEPTTVGVLVTLAHPVADGTRDANGKLVMYSGTVVDLSCTITPV